MTQKQARDIIILLVLLIGAVGYNAYVNSRPTVVWYQELTPEPDLTATADERWHIQILGGNNIQRSKMTEKNGEGRQPPPIR